MAHSALIFTNRPAEALLECVDSLGDVDRAFILTDSNTERLVAAPLAAQSKTIATMPRLTVLPGEVSKSIDTAARLWSELLEARATRRSLLINIGGGVVGDLGGFVASTYMRGIRFINIPTTILSAVDASVGGKTAINLDTVKNAVGTFTEPEAVVIDSRFFTTLPRNEVLSGAGEMLKHALLSSPEAFSEFIDFDLDTPFSDPAWARITEQSIEVKRRIVEIDFRESGLRKQLNLGHTTAHAVESVTQQVAGSPVAHGCAVAWGLVTALVISRMRFGARLAPLLYTTADYVRNYYGAFPPGCKLNQALIEAMTHDKKNRNNREINFTLLRAPGEPVVDAAVTPDEISAALDITRDLTS